MDTAAKQSLYDNVGQDETLANRETTKGCALDIEAVMALMKAQKEYL